jgi:hypothetical protein
MADEEGKILRWEPGPGPGGDVTVLTAEFCEPFGGCEKCPGWTKVAELRKGNEVDEAVEGDQTVFCVDWCHRVAPEV